MRFTYSKEQIQFLREGFPKMFLPELTDAFNTRFSLNKTPGQLKAAMKNHRIRCGRKSGEYNKGRLRAFTYAQKDYIEEKYKLLSLSELTNEFNKQFDTDKSESQIRGFIRNQKIKSGRTGHYEKGSAPFNKGTVGLMKPNSGTFKKGHVPATIKPLGSERICSRDGFILVKIAERNPHTGCATRYKHKHIIVWEKHNGPVPEGKVVAFIDGDKMNCSPDNLMLISRAVLLYLNRNGYKDIQDELKPTLRALAALVTKQSSLVREA